MAAWTAGYSDDGMLESAVLPAVKGQIKGMNGAQVEHFSIRRDDLFQFQPEMCLSFFGMILLLVEQKYLSINQVADVDASISCG